VAETTGAKRVGRRRDPSIEPKVNAAVVRLYAREGWNGLTFDAVAREACVGKPAIYRRWDTREDLLVRAIDTLRLPIARDCGSLRADLLDFAQQWVDWYGDADRGHAAQRLAADIRTNPALAERYAAVIGDPRVKAARAITHRAVQRGEVGPGVHSSTIPDLLVGALNVHWHTTPEGRQRRLRQTFKAYAGQLIDVILAGVATLAPPEDREEREAPARATTRRRVAAAQAGPSGDGGRVASRESIRVARSRSAPETHAPARTRSGHA